MILKKHVITGGPCSGKTTTIEALAKKGFKTIGEASRILIEEQTKSGGDLVPWKRLYDFNSAVTSLQLKLESQALAGVYFLDRGIIDNLAYCEWGQIDIPPELANAAQSAKYDKIFLLLPLEKYENDPARKEDMEDSARLTALLKKAYNRTGHQVIEVPPLPVRERVEFILERI